MTISPVITGMMVSLLSAPSYGLNVTATYTAMRLARTFASNSVTVTDSSLTLTHQKQAGLFNSGSSTIDFSSGAVLSNAFATNAKLRWGATIARTSDALGGQRFGPLTSLLTETQATGNACVLRIRFKCSDPAHNAVAFKYVLGSDDYPSCGSNRNNDLVGAFLNGNAPTNNMAIVSGKIVSVNTIHQGSSWYKDNTKGAYETEMKGFTKPFLASGPAKSCINVLTLAVADAGKKGDVHFRNGAWAFVGAGALQCLSNKPTSSPNMPLIPTPSPTKRPTATLTRKPTKNHRQL